MHELSLAIDLVERAVEIAKKENAHSIKILRIAIGEQSGVDAQALAFAFTEAIRGTFAVNAKLEIKQTQGREFQFESMEVEDV